jgi:hypothetical protein
MKSPGEFGNEAAWLKYYRFYTAAKVMQGIVTGYSTSKEEADMWIRASDRTGKPVRTLIAQDAVLFTDALIEALNQTPTL